MLLSVFHITRTRRQKKLSNVDMFQMNALDSQERAKWHSVTDILDKIHKEHCSQVEDFNKVCDFAVR